MNERGIEIGDRVTVNGYSDKIFRVMGVKYEHKYIYGVMYDGFILRVIDTKTCEILDVFESDVSLYKKYIPSTKENIQKQLSKIETKWQEYEDYLTLYEMLGDEEYRDKAVKIYVGLVKNRNK